MIKIKTMVDLYSRWGNYIPADIRKQFQKEWLEVEEMLVKNNSPISDVIGNTCKECKEPLQKQFRFCSMTCKDRYYR
jgi:hypothetical protein